MILHYAVHIQSKVNPPHTQNELTAWIIIVIIVVVVVVVANLF